MSPPWHARWFDGHTSAVHPVLVWLEGGLLRIHPGAGGPFPSQLPAGLPAAQLLVGERFRGAPRMIGLPDGGSLQVEDDATWGFDRALREAGHLPAPVYRLFEGWRYVLLCLLLLVAVIVWVDRQGVGLMADIAVQFVPESLDERLGRSALELADDRWLTPSQVPEPRRRRIAERFARLVQAQYPQLKCPLWFRDTAGGRDDFNAFAVPGGTIVLLDGLVKAMDDDEVLAVLGHELGHVVHRDGMHGVAQQLGLAAVAGVVWGDMSGLASVAAGFQGLHYSRAMEADAFAVIFLRRGGIPVRRLADAFAVIEREETTRASLPAFLSDHPATEQRLRAAEAAAGRQGSAAAK